MMALEVGCAGAPVQEQTVEVMSTITHCVKVHHGAVHASANLRRIVPATPPASPS
jgi:hypothetical protein